MDNRASLLNNLHTTELGAVRVRRNLNLLDDIDVIAWVKDYVQDLPVSAWNRSGKNWYIVRDDVTMTVNAHSSTLITAHRRKTIHP